MICYQNYTTKQEQEEVLELARKLNSLYLARGMEIIHSEEKVFLIWRNIAQVFDKPLLDVAKEDVEDAEFEAELNAKAMTCAERRERKAAHMGVSLEKYEGLFKHDILLLRREELSWLQSRTGERNKTLDKRIEQHTQSRGEWLCAKGMLKEEVPTQEQIAYVDALEKEVEALGDDVEKDIIAEVQRLENKLQLRELLKKRASTRKARTPRPVPFRRCDRARARAPRSVRRASFSMAGSSPGGGDDSGESDSGDPPGSKKHLPLSVLSSVTSPSNNNHCNHSLFCLSSWLVPGSCRMGSYSINSEGRRVA
ncbi:MAG: hypothetical protein GX256_03355 [Fretibacterium sp.]|nr:hypothetical protein [Fretibacterium sp.]